MKHLSSLLLLGLLAEPGAAHGQSYGGAPVGWVKLSADVPLRGNWSVYTEVETRQSNAHLSAQQLGRLGFRWNPTSTFNLTTGYVLAANEFDAIGDNITAPEHRLYQEVALSDASGLLRVGHRLRAEERWLRPAPDAAFQFAPRVRYQLRLVVPLRSGGKLPVGGLFLVAADELFAGLGSRKDRSFLEENRASAGLGYRMNRRTTVEVAYLRQTQAAGAAGQALTRNAVQVSVAITTPNSLTLAR
ncbi:MAG TPA: DUF2490 domain-containing protein [Hymenobacter sp.]|jgi:hypothetical protein